MNKHDLKKEKKVAERLLRKLGFKVLVRHSCYDNSHVSALYVYNLELGGYCASIYEHCCWRPCWPTENNSGKWYAPSARNMSKEISDTEELIDALLLRLQPEKSGDQHAVRYVWNMKLDPLVVASMIVKLSRLKKQEQQLLKG